MLPPRAESYIRHTSRKGRDPETIVLRWNRGYPDAPITESQVKEVIKASKTVAKKPKAKKRGS